MTTNDAISDMLREEKPCKKSKKGGAKGSVASLKGVHTSGLCVSRFVSEKIYSEERLKIGTKTRRQIRQGHVAPKKIWERKGPSREIVQKCAPHGRTPCAPRSESMR